MSTFLVIVTKYLFILLMFFYVWECFSALRCKNPYKASGIFQRQNGIIFLTYFLGIATIFLNQKDTTDIGVIVLGGAQLCYLIVVLGIFPIIYPNINKAILSNMCMLLTIGFIILARLKFQYSIRQFIIVAIVSMASLIVPYLMSRYEMWKSFTWIYCFVGLALLISVLILGEKTGGANLSIQIGGFAFQPSEFVKIIFVFFLAGLLSRSTEFKNIVLSNICIDSGCFQRPWQCIDFLYGICFYGVYCYKEGAIYICVFRWIITGFSICLSYFFPCPCPCECMAESVG